MAKSFLFATLRPYAELSPALETKHPNQISHESAAVGWLALSAIPFLPRLTRWGFLFGNKNYGVLYLSGQTSLPQGGAAQGGVKSQKYRDPNQPARANSAVAPMNQARIPSAPSDCRCAWVDVLD
jgi:hypothetical protein